jgi:ribosomal protein S18 acetylase RimI-like enzyme
MVAVPMISPTASGHIRKINLARDLDHIADLLELCFPIHLDPDGQTFIREMRLKAQEMRIMNWLSRLDASESQRIAGFVWEENGNIIGNISLIPFQEKGKRIHLIANVAVHPDFRNKGIARALTERALGYLNRRNEPDIWLQVREDNPAAIQLYRSAGFKDEAVRTTWRIRPFAIRIESTNKFSNFSIRPRRSLSWERQKAWLDAAYPQKIRWNLPVNFDHLEPGILPYFINMLNGNRFRHWEVKSGDEPCGVISWQKTTTYANNLWLALSPVFEESHLPKVLNHVLGYCAPRHPLSIDYPAGVFTAQFEHVGFRPFRTLIWMRLVH